MKDAHLISLLLTMLGTLGSLFLAVARRYHNHMVNERAEKQATIEKLQARVMMLEQQLGRRDSDIKALRDALPRINGRYRMKRVD